MTLGPGPGPGTRSDGRRVLDPAPGPVLPHPLRATTRGAGAIPAYGLPGPVWRGRIGRLFHVERAAERGTAGHGRVLGFLVLGLAGGPGWSAGSMPHLDSSRWSLDGSARIGLRRACSPRGRPVLGSATERGRAGHLAGGLGTGSSTASSRGVGCWRELHAWCGVHGTEIWRTVWGRGWGCGEEQSQGQVGAVWATLGPSTSSGRSGRSRGAYGSGERRTPLSHPGGAVRPWSTEEVLLASSPSLEGARDLGVRPGSGCSEALARRTSGRFF